MTGWIVLGLGVLALVVGVSMYNRLVALRNRMRNAFSQIDVQLKRRYDLIPNLVETAKGALGHERETLEAVIAARGAALTGLQRVGGDPTDQAAMKELVAAEGQLGGALGRLLAVAESYPDLKANQNMMQLTEELTSTENKVGFARQAYNDSVTVYNTACETVPTSIIAGMFGFQLGELFAIEDAAQREAPRVSFD